MALRKAERKRLNGTIILVEDDRVTVEELSEVLGDEFPLARLEVMDSESSFLEHLKTWESPPSIVILDVMLRWSSVASSSSAPPEVLAGGFQEAGHRCRQALELVYPTKPPAICLLTALPESEFQGVPTGRATLLRKDLDWSRLVETIAKALT